MAVGTHPSGVRYEWAGNWPTSIPELSIEQVNKLWRVLHEKFGTEPFREQGASRGRMNAVAWTGATDPVADFLEAQGLVREEGLDGQLYIECPWKHEHTTESGCSETAYFRAGTRGYERGHFKCFHAHCEERTDAEFTRAIGFDDAGFEAEPAGDDRGA